MKQIPHWPQLHTQGRNWWKNPLHFLVSRFFRLADPPLVTFDLSPDGELARGCSFTVAMSHHLVLVTLDPSCGSTAARSQRLNKLSFRANQLPIAQYRTVIRHWGQVPHCETRPPRQQTYIWHQSMLFLVMIHCTTRPAGEDLRLPAASLCHGWVTASAVKVPASRRRTTRPNICVWITASKSDILRWSVIQPPAIHPLVLTFAHFVPRVPLIACQSVSPMWTWAQ